MKIIDESSYHQAIIRLSHSNHSIFIGYLRSHSPPEIVGIYLRPEIIQDIYDLEIILE